MEDRAWPTVALTSLGRSRGASVFRVHEVRPNVEALRMTEAILDNSLVCGIAASGHRETDGHTQTPPAVLPLPNPETASP